MLGRTKGVALLGVEGQVVEVEADAASGLPAFTIVGLPDAALAEARDRVRAAIGNSGLPFSLRRLTVNLQPAGLHKAGTSFDLSRGKMRHTMNMTPRRTAIYTRISSDREGAGLGVQRQEKDCRELASRLGWPVVAVYSDNDLSAYSGKPRPGYKALLEGLRSGGLDSVIAWHPDRLHRQPVELEEFVEVCQTRGTAVQTVRAGSVDLTTASGQMVARMLGAAARYEVDHSRERMKRAKAEAAAAGKWRGGRRPLGYADDGVTVVPQEAALLLDAARQIVAGASLAATARRAAEKGLRTATGKPVDSVALRRLLVRPRNAGLVEQHGEIVGIADWPAIIPEDIWRAVVAILSDPTRRTTPGPERRWLGSGIYLCGICGHTLRVTLAGAQARARVYTDPAKHVTRRAEDVDPLVRGVIAARLAGEDAADLLAQNGAFDTSFGDQAESLALRQRLEELAGLFADGSVTRAQLAEGSRKIRDRLEAVEARLTAAAKGSALTGIVSAPSPVAAWQAAPLDVQRAVVDALVTVTILPARRGRPAGWQPGDGYFDPGSVSIVWKLA